MLPACWAADPLIHLVHTIRSSGGQEQVQVQVLVQVLVLVLVARL